MKRLSTLSLTLMLAVALALVACERQAPQTDQQPGGEQAEEAAEQERTEPEQEAQEQEQAEQQEADEVAIEPSDQVREQIETAITAYDEIRARLVQDSTEGLQEQASRMHEAAAAAAEEAEDNRLVLRLEHLAAKAEEFQNLAEQVEIDHVRGVYGEVSKALVGLISDVPSLQEDLYIYECGMADGYQKWVQRQEEKANPYMGQEMPKCGSPTDWEV